MLITIEGPDCAGKSTLTQQLLDAARERGLVGHRLHKGPPAPGADPFTEYESELDVPSLSCLIDADHHLVVMDRWHVGEAIYGPLWRGCSRLTLAGLAHVEAALDALGALRVMCLPPYDKLRHRFLSRGDDHTKLEELPRIHDEYREHAERFDYAVLTGGEDRRYAVTNLLDLAARHTKRAEGVRTWGRRTYVGPLWPSYLLVGDERNAGPRPDLTRPFTPVNGAGCSRWLWDAVLETRLHTEIGIINAHELGIELRHLWHALDEPRVVALGNRASAALAHLQLEHATVRHPQYSKRFEHRNFDGYVTSLEEAMSGDH